MVVGLASCRCENGNAAFNLSQIERMAHLAAGKADLLCFGEAFLQGFDALCWDYETDRETAVSLDSGIMGRLMALSRASGVGILTGYIERAGEALYSSCAVMDGRRLVHNYRRVSRGWKDYWRTDEHYREGRATGTFAFRGTDFMPALCGDLWDCPERFETDAAVIWPVYVNYTVDEWEQEGVADYARQAARVSRRVLMVNPIDRDPENHGGAFFFRDGGAVQRLPFDREGILYVEVN